MCACVHIHVHCMRLSVCVCMLSLSLPPSLPPSLSLTHETRLVGLFDGEMCGAALTQVREILSSCSRCHVSELCTLQTGITRVDHCKETKVHMKVMPLQFGMSRKESAHFRTSCRATGQFRIVRSLDSGHPDFN